MIRDRWLWIILLLGVAVRLYGLGERSLSYDECQQYWASQGNALISNREITLDPPLFAVLLHAWSLVGRSETWLRLLPCLLGILGIPAIYGLSQRISGDASTARVAALFFALAPYPIRYSQSLRVYSLTLLLCALLPAAWLAGKENDSLRRRFRIAVLTCAGLLAMYGVIWLAGTLLAAALLFPASGDSWNRLGRAGFLIAGMVAALPFYLYSLPTQMSQGTPGYFYEDKFLPLDHLSSAVTFLGRGLLGLSGYFSFVHPASALLFGALALLGMARLARDPSRRPMLLVFALAILAAAGASAFRLYPFGATRQMLYAAPLFYAFAAHGILALRPLARGSLTLLCVAALMVGCGVFLYRYHTGPGGQEMRPVMSYLAQHASPTDRILVNKDAIPQFRFYYAGDPGAVVWGRETVIRDYLAEVNRLLDANPSARFWLVFS
ncbi:MAG: glycosyltransferase family 39 protein, partial [Acidobacteria bacterium]|nr:glycosyltransferase family 39 protein [Acidobacteriota bacterium]